MVHDVQDCGFYKLSLHDRCDNFDHWFSREDYGSFRDRVDITGEFEVAQVLKEIFLKDAKASQIGDVFFCETEILDVFDHLLQSGTDSKTTATWIVAVEHIKDNGLVGRVFEISLHHGKLIEVREQSKVICSHKVLL